MTQKPEVKIRSAESEDAGLLAELGARTFDQTFAADNTQEDMNAYITASFGVAQQRAELADPASNFLIAEVDGVAAGYAQLHDGAPADCVTGPQTVELTRLYVLDEWLGRGVGPALMSACLDQAQQVFLIHSVFLLSEANRRRLSRNS